MDVICYACMPFLPFFPCPLTLLSLFMVVFRFVSFSALISHGKMTTMFDECFLVVGDKVGTLN
jgi:hypothetical protein